MSRKIRNCRRRDFRNESLAEGRLPRTVCRILRLELAPLHYLSSDRSGSSLCCGNCSNTAQKPSYTKSSSRILCCRMAVAAAGARFPDTRDQRAAVLGAHDPARNPDADLRAPAGSEPARGAVFVGPTRKLASACCWHSTAKFHQAYMANDFGSYRSLVLVCNRVMGMACASSVRRGSR